MSAGSNNVALPEYVIWELSLVNDDVSDQSSDWNDPTTVCTDLR